MSDAWDDQMGANRVEPEGDDPDLIEQHMSREADDVSALRRLDSIVDPEVPMADAWEQSLPAPVDDDYR